MNHHEALTALSKDALIEIHRAVFGNVGDTARTSKQAYIDKLLTADPDALAVALADAPAPRKASPLPPTEAATQLLQIVQSLAGSSVNEERVRDIIRDELANVEPRRIVVTPTAETKIDEHTHPAFEEVLQAVAGGNNVLLVGPAGCGKTHLAEQIARSLGREFGALHCTAGASESQLLGWLFPTGDGGRFEYIPAPFATLYERGNAVFLLDELDAADPNMTLVINGALANGHLHIPQRYTSPCIKRGENMCVIAAANTFGTGADMVYAGRNQIDGATLDRFYPIPMTYDTALEKQLADADVCEWVWDIRSRIEEKKLRRVMSTRSIQKADAMLRQGAEWSTVKTRLLAGWTRDELAKVGL